MTDTVVTHERFQRDKVEQVVDLSSLEDLKVVTASSDEFDELEWEDPQYGEDILGTLTDQEAALVVEFKKTKSDHEAMNRKIASEFLTDMAKVIAEGKEKEYAEREDRLPPEMAQEFFRLHRKIGYLSAVVGYTLASKFDCFDHTLTIRTKRRVCKAARMW